jgi:ribulose-5-phosphate 4-epimerase/fuculose-1-phosphate aldolase
MPDLEEFIKVTAAIGKIIPYVQGGGGNTSLKLDERRMAVKSSGMAMSAVTSKHGYSIVDYPKILSTKDAVNIEDFVIEGRHPSMETGFHAVLGTFVLHTHSIYTNAISCADSGQAIINQLFPDAIWVPYVTPGQPLTDQIKSLIGDTIPAVLFLENHGLIVSAATPQEGYDIHEAVHATLKKEFRYQFTFDLNLANGDMAFLMSHLLFPDQAIYTASPALIKTQAGIETRAAYFAILQLMSEIGLTPRFLPFQEAAVLLSLDSEKFRQGLCK